MCCDLTRGCLGKRFAASVTPVLTKEDTITAHDFIQWFEESRRLKDLRPFERNPRTISESQFDKLVQSLVQDGYHSRIKVTRDGRMIGGHQRLKALAKLGFEEIQVLVPDCELDDEAFKRICLRDNHNNGTWDMDILASDYDLEFLRAVGLHDVMNIPPMEDAQDDNAGRKMVCCPKCQHNFPVKGNGVKNG